MTTGKLVGARVKRVEDARYLLGEGRYLGGMSMPGMLEVAFLRSTHAHAKLRAIDTAAARALPGVEAVFAWSDLADRLAPLRADLDPEKNPTYKPCAWTPLASGKVRWAGEAIVAVAATNRYVAEDAAALVEVDLEPLPAVVDPEAALADRTNLVHDEWGDNVLCHTDFASGDVDGAFARAKAVVRRRFRTGRHHALPLETRGCLAHYERVSGELTLWTSSQMQHMVRTKLAEHLGHPENKVRVIAPDVGGGFGLKCHFFPEEAVVAAMAMKLGRPVRWLEDRRESLISSFHAKEEIVDAEIALDADGQILAARVKALADIGAYSAFPWTSAFEVLHMAQMLPGPYRFQTYAFSASSVATNKSTLSVYRGVGAPIGTFVMEGLLDEGAAALGLDPVEIRRRNLLRPEEFPYRSVTGMEYEIGSYVECLEKAAVAADYQAFRKEQAELRARGVYRGIGFSCYNEITALGSKYWYGIGVPMSAYESVNIRIEPSGDVTLFCGTHSEGQAHETVYAQIASDELGIPMERIAVRLGDTRESPYGWGTWGSRGAVTAGGAITLAGRKLASKLKRVAGHFLEVAPEEIELVGGRAQLRGAPARYIEISALAKRAIFTAAAELPAGEEPGLDQTTYWDPPPVTFPNATHVAVVEVDVQTGKVDILRYIVVEDCGKMINPMVVDGQITGGVAQGLGGAMLEHILYDDAGQILTSSLMDYLLPSAADVPFIEIGHVETPSPLVPGGFKGAGEGGAIAPFGALANAVGDALGVRACELPLSPERVLALAAQRSV